MRRLRDRANGRFFRGGEFPRLMAMILMLIVLVMMMQNARNPDTWRYFTGQQAKGSFTLDEILAAEQSGGGLNDDAKPAADPEPEPTSEQETESIEGAQTAQTETTSDSQGSQDDNRSASDNEFKVTDLDPDQREAVVEQFEVVSDRAPLEKQDMGAYWRLVMWTKAQTFEQLDERARRDILFTHLAEEPEKYRGKLVHLDLHVRRTLTYETEEVLPGVKRMYEAWGPSKESKPNWPYCVVFPDAPEGLPFGANVKQRAVFAGYFLKLISYDAVDGKKRWAPLLVGRLEYDKSATTPAEIEAGNSNLWIWAAGGIIVCFFAVRMFLSMRSRQPVASRLRGVLTSRDAPDGDPVDVEQWLSQAEDAQSHPDIISTEINPAAPHEQNGGRHLDGGHLGEGGERGGRLDWPSERER